MRPSIGAVDFGGIIPYSDKFDTVGEFARDAEAFAKLSKALYGPINDSGCKKKPTKILYPTDYWAIDHEESEALFEQYVAKLESYLGVKRTQVSLEEVWQTTKPLETELSLSEYFEHVFKWSANPDQLTGFMRDFLGDYKSTFERAAVLNPQLQFKRKYLPTVTQEQQARGIELLKTFRSWWEDNIVPSSTDSCTDTILVLPWSKGQSDYRDTYRQSAQKFTGIGFFFYNLSPYAGAPEIIVPAGQTSYLSRLTEREEFLPAAIGIIGSKGSHVGFAEFVLDFLGTDGTVEVGRVAFKLASDYAVDEHTDIEQKVLMKGN